MIIFAFDDCTGTNGAAPNASYWATGGGDTAGASETIQGNRIRINNGTVTSYGGQAALKYVGTRSGNTVDVSCIVNTAATTDSNVEIWINSSDSSMVSGNGYALPVGPPSGGTIQMIKATGFTYPTIGPTKSMTINSATDYGVRINVGGVGPVTIRWKVWAASSPEPSKWDAEFIDASSPYNSGNIYLHTVGGGSASGTSDFDNILITDGGDPYGALLARRPSTIYVTSPWTLPQPALPVLVLPPSYLGAQEVTIQVTNDTGPAPFGLAATATSVKVVTATAQAGLGLAGTSASAKLATGTTAAGRLGLSGIPTSRKVAPGTAAGQFGLAGTTTARKVAPETARGALALAGTTTARKVSTPASSGPLGLVSTTTARKVSTPAVRGALGLAGSGADVKKATGTTASAAVGLAGNGTGRKVAPETARAAVGLLGLATAKHVATASGRGAVALVGYPGPINKVSGASLSAGALGLSGAGTGRKTALVAVGGPGVVGLFGTSTHDIAVLLPGVSFIGLDAWASPTKKATGATGPGALGLVGTTTARKVSTAAGRGALGLAGSGADTKSAGGSAAGQLGLAGSGADTKRAGGSARGLLGATGTGTARKVSRNAGTGFLGVTGWGGSRKAATPAATAALGLINRAIAGKTTAKTAVASLGLAATGSLIIVRSFVARAALGLAATAREVFHFEVSRLGGWTSLQAVLDDERAYLRTAGSEAMLACPFCGEPLVGDVCPFEAIHVAQYGPPTISEESMPTADNPGPWGSLLGILRDAASNAEDEARTPEVACPRCGEPLVAGHCTFDGYQTWADEG